MNRDTRRRMVADIRRLAQQAGARMEAAPIAYPLGPPTYSGNQLTVDTALNQPTRVTRRIAELSLQNLIVSAIYASGPSPSGGAVVYDQALLNELYLERDVERVAPGDEFPIVTSVRQAPKVALVEKYGGKFFVTDEARERNNVTSFNNQVNQLANTITRKLNTRAIAELEVAIAGMNGATTFVGQNWGAVVTAGTSASNNAAFPAADFAKAQMLADVDELGVEYNLWLLNPQQAYQLAIAYGSDLAEVLRASNISTFVSNRITPGTAYAVAQGQVGELGFEKGLSSESWREPRNEITWLQSSLRPIQYVTNPYSIRKITGLAG